VTAQLTRQPSGRLGAAQHMAMWEFTYKSAHSAIKDPSLALSVIVMSNKDYYSQQQQQYYPPQGAFSLY
jgi:hypothetical protein